jgi:Ca-activated chloride channel family protein
MLYEWIKNIHFAYSENFLLLGIIPFLLWWYLRKNNSQQASISVSAAKAFSVSSIKVFFRHTPFFIRLLVLSALVMALARPQKRNDQQRTEGEGIDIVLCMDVSGSMNSPDILPSRMEVAKQVAEEFIMSRPVDRIGIVIFSGESFTLSPITTDKNTLISQVRALESRKYLADGTVIGEGLATSVDRLSKSSAKSKVVILLTDGKEDPPETRLIDPLTALEVAKARNVKVYTIGMSAAPTAASEVSTQPPGRRNPASSYLDEELLRRIATETGGRYFRARDKEGLQNIYKQVDQMEKSRVEITAFKKTEELFVPFVLAALGLLFIEVLLRFIVFRRFP